MKIKINELNFKYDYNHIFQDLSLEFNKGKFHGILGPNGCGKTTLLKTIIKILKIEDNSIYHNNEDINQIERTYIAKNIAYVEQSSNNLPKIKVIEYINLARYTFDDYYKKDNLIVLETIKLLKIEKLKDKYITQLSGGELQKVIIARALAQETKIIILDEPTANLDPLHQLEIMDLLKYLVKEKEITIITTLHDINLALAYCDEVLLIKDKLITQGLTQKIINKNNIKTYFNLNSHFINNPLTNKPYVILNQEKN
ncbi:MAG: ABC transporter ATP-binding protein [Pleomorphochaeta sp.]